MLEQGWRKWRKSFTVGLVVPYVIAGLAGCGESTSQQAQPGPGSAPPAVPVTVTSVIEKIIQPYGEWTGRMEAPESVEIRSRVAAVIEQVNFKAGQKVRRGDVLFKLDARPFEAELARAQAQLAAAVTQAELSKSEAARSKKLFEGKAASQQELDQLNAQHRNADAAVKSAEAAVRIAKLNLDYTTIRAPIDGRVSRPLVTAGNLIGVATPILTTLVAMDRVHVYVAMSEQSYLRSMETFNAQGRIPVSMGLADETGLPHTGTLDFVDNHVNASTGTVQVRAVFDNSKGNWMPGLFARVKVPEGAPVKAIVIPDRAVGTDQSKKVVWIVAPDKTANPRNITLGTAVDGLRIVTSGLKEGEVVVVDGIQRLQPGMPVQPEMMKEEKKTPLEPVADAVEPAPEKSEPAKPASEKPAPAVKPTSEKPTSEKPTSEKPAPEGDKPKD